MDIKWRICNTSQDAWEQINKALFIGEKDLKDKGEGREGNVMLSYENVLFITKAWVDPEFDFGKIFGYTTNKWAHLVNNYVDRNYLDIVKVEVAGKEKKKQRHYSVTKRFGNQHQNGKDCLISITFSRRINSDVPVVIVNTRATEVTKRLLMDLLLAQRLGEYVYGIKQTFSIIFYAPIAYLHMDSFCMYNNHKDIIKMLNGKPTQPLQASIIKNLNMLLTKNPDSINYLSSQRIAKHLQGKLPFKPLLARNLLLIDLKYPVDCFTDKQRKEYRKSIKKQQS